MSVQEHQKINSDQVIAVMNRFEFGSGFGHGKQKDFVQNYWKELQAKHQAGSNHATIGQ